jgi:hypothetical protein
MSFPNDVETEAGSGTHRFCGEEWIEDAIAYLLRDSRPIVDHAHDDVIPFAHGARLNMPFCPTASRALSIRLDHT